MTKVEIGKGITLDVDTQRINAHETVFGHIVYIGLRNILMDSHASVKRDDCESDADYREKSLAQAQKKLDAMYNGTIRANSSGPRASSVDPVQAEALRMARVFVHTNAKGWEKGTESAIDWLVKVADKIGWELPEPMTVDAWKPLIARAIELRAARDDVQKAAKETVEAKAKLVVNADDLGL